MLHDSTTSAENPTQERVWAEIDLVALSHNLREIRARSNGARILLVVKANAYGHGMNLIAKHALRVGIAGLCVATPSEAASLRTMVGPGPRVVLLGPWLESEAESLLHSNAELCLHQEDQQASLEKLAAKLGLQALVHLNIDTGLGRLGLEPGAAIHQSAALLASKNLSWVGTMTHLASAQGPEDPITLEQLARFEAFRRNLVETGLTTEAPMCHVESSAAIFSAPASPPGSRYSTIRPGISAYGSLPSAIPGSAGLQPVLSLRTRIANLRPIPSGHAVGYSATWRATRPTKLATLPIGYADGLPWRLAGRQGFALVRGQRVPIVGRVSMDMTTLDVTDVEGACSGDIVTLIGADGTEQIRCEDLAEQTGTIPYEIFCSLGTRVKRLATREEEALQALEIPQAIPDGSASAALKSPPGRFFSAKRAHSLPSTTHGEPQGSGGPVFDVDQER